MTMTEEERSELACARLSRLADSYAASIKTVVLHKLHDTFTAEEVLASEDAAKAIVLGVFQRITLECIAEDLGPEKVNKFFENAYWQISSQKIGTKDFPKTHRPPACLAEEE